MEFVQYVVDLFLHLDKHLDVIIEQYGAWTYLILLVIVFCETGLVVTPFLPGDSLLFVAGTFAGAGALDIRVLIPLLLAAAVLGDHGQLLDRQACGGPGARLGQPARQASVRPAGAGVLRPARQEVHLPRPLCPDRADVHAVLLGSR